jgi:DNA-3-methyladenine glycosylase
LEPAAGLDLMQMRRPVANPLLLTNGPGKLCAAMAISGQLDGADLCDAASPVFIARNASRAAILKRLGPVINTPRIGITRAAERSLRFCLGGSRFLSRRP